MEQQDYHSSIIVRTDVANAFKSVLTGVSEWWTPDLEGESKQEGDQFTVHFGDTFVTFKITELVTNLTIVWQVTVCYLPWLQDKTEWTGTRLVWNFETDGADTRIDLTHVGLVPAIECYESCAKGWNFFFNESLYKLLATGKGMPNKTKSER